MRLVVKTMSVRKHLKQMSPDRWLTKKRGGTRRKCFACLVCAHEKTRKEVCQRLENSGPEGKKWIFGGPGTLFARKCGNETTNPTPRCSCGLLTHGYTRNLFYRCPYFAYFRPSKNSGKSMVPFLLASISLLMLCISGSAREIAW